MDVASGSIVIPEREIELSFIRSSGPGGQNVNKVASAVQLRFDVARSPSLPDPVRMRLMALAGRRLTGEGVLVLTATRHRSQERNRADALERLTDLIARAAEPPPPHRRKTRPPARAVRKRRDEKARRGAAKRLRSRPRDET